MRLTLAKLSFKGKTMKKTITALTIFAALISPFLVLGQTKHRPIETTCQVAIDTKHVDSIAAYNAKYNNGLNISMVILPHAAQSGDASFGLSITPVSEPSNLFKFTKNDYSRFVLKIYVSTRLKTVDVYLGIYYYDQKLNRYTLIAKSNGSSTVSFFNNWNNAYQESLFAAYQTAVGVFGKEFSKNANYGCPSD